MERLKPFYALDCHGRVESIKFSQDGTLFAALISRQSIEIRHTATYQEIISLTMPAFVWDFSLAPDNKTIAVVTAERTEGQPVSPISTITCFDILTGKETVRREIRNVCAITHSNAQSSLIVMALNSRQGDRSCIEIYDSQLITCVRRLALPHKIDLTFRFDFNPSTNLLASAGCGAYLWDMGSYRCRWDLIKADKWGRLKGKGIDYWEADTVAISRNGRYFAIGHWGHDGGKTEKVCLYNISTRKVMGWYCRGYNAIDSVALSPNGRFIAVTGDKNESRPLSGTARIWEITSNELVGECTLDGMAVVAFSPDGRFILTGANAPHSLVVWELPAADPLAL